MPMKVKLVMAVTADGKIARHVDDPVDWTGKADKKKFVRITKECGVVIMGSRTFDAIGCPLPQRLNVVMTRNPERVSRDEHLVFTGEPPAAVLADLEKKGYTEAALIGGSIINSLFAEEKLIDEVYLTLVPEIFGSGISLFSRPLDMPLELIAVDRIDTDCLLLHYRVKNSPHVSL